MSNEYLEALEHFVRTSVWNEDEFHEIWDNGNFDLEIVKKALQRLEAIDNAKPSEAFECLKSIEGWTTMFRSHKYDLLDYDLDTIKQTLIKAYEDGEENERLWNDITTVDKQYTDLMLDYQEQRKVLEIIFEKNVDIIRIRHLIFKSQKNPKYWDLRYYNEARVIDDEKLTQEEFELLKRYFK